VYPEYISQTVDTRTNKGQEMNILENELTVAEQQITLAGIELAEAQKTLRTTNVHNKVAMFEARNAVDFASGKLGMAYDRLIEIRKALIAVQVGA
jgi:uncharacterized protein (DUF2164 family)